MSVNNILSSPLLLSVALGVVGSISRILIQIVSAGEETRSILVLGSLLALGAIGGGLAYLITGYVPLAIWALGFVAPDVLENLADAYSPGE